MSPTTIWTWFQRAVMRAIRGRRGGSTAATSTPNEVPDGGTRGGRADSPGQARRFLPSLQGLVCGYWRFDTERPTRSRSCGADRIGGAGCGYGCMDTDHPAVGIDDRDGHGDGPGITPIVCHDLAGDDGGDDASHGGAT